MSLPQARLVKVFLARFVAVSEGMNRQEPHNRQRYVDFLEPALRAEWLMRQAQDERNIASAYGDEAQVDIEIQYVSLSHGAATVRYRRLIGATGAPIATEQRTAQLHFRFLPTVTTAHARALDGLLNPLGLEITAFSIVVEHEVGHEQNPDQ